VIELVIFIHSFPLLLYIRDGYPKGRGEWARQFSRRVRRWLPDALPSDHINMYFITVLNDLFASGNNLIAS
jgi:hypothetical protein